MAPVVKFQAEQGGHSLRIAEQKIDVLPVNARLCTEILIKVFYLENVP